MSNNNCYAKGEQEFMRWGQNLRAKMLLPLLQWFVRMSVRPDHITFLSLVSGLIGAGMFYFSPATALILILLHVVFDGIDGPLARHMGVGSNKGSYTDTAADQLVLSAIVFVLMDMQIIWPVMGGVYILLYTVMIGFSMVRNALNVPYQFVLRPRFLLYVWIIVELYFYPQTVNYMLFACNVIFIPTVFLGFNKIRSVL